MPIRFRRVKTVLSRELLDLRKNPMVVGTMAAMPTLLVSLSLIMNAVLSRIDDKKGKEALRLAPELASLPQREATMIVLNDQLMMMLLIIPAVLPMTIATYSIVGEKQTRTLEPLLSTPITTTELLVGKALAAFLPSLALGWLAIVVAMTGVQFLAPASVAAAIVRPTWIVGGILHAPLVSVLSTLASVLSSSRATDPRAAQQIGAAFVLPIVGLAMAVMFGGLMGGLFLRPSMQLVAAAVLVVVDLVLLRAAVAVFDREAILTRWK